MTVSFEERMRARLQDQAARASVPVDPVGDVRQRVRRQDLALRTGGGAAALATVVLAVVIGLPALAGGQITFDDRAADGGSPAPDVSAAPDLEGSEGADGTAESDGEQGSRDPDAADAGDLDAQPDEAHSDAAHACSAADVVGGPASQPGLPAAVASARERIFEAAIACDYAALAMLAGQSEQFTFSFGGGDDPEAHWRQAEAEGEPVMLLLAELLQRPHATVEGAEPALFAWPSAFQYERWSEVPTEDREALRPLYDESDFEDFASFGSYIGYRVGISADGQWRYFVAGD